MVEAARAADPLLRRLLAEKAERRREYEANRLPKSHRVREPRGYNRFNTIHMLRQRDGDLCHWCREPITDGFDPAGMSGPGQNAALIQNWKNRASIEHLTARSEGGTNHGSNLVLVHNRCNR